MSNPTNEYEEIEETGSHESSKKQVSLCDYFKEKQNDQDFMQKVNVFLTLILEFYRVLMGAFLIVFVPQQCGEQACSMNENISREDDLTKVAVSLNSITMAMFLFLYFIEVKRENKLISYLEVNKFTALDNKSVGEALEKISTSKKEAIWKLDKHYQNIGYSSTISFLLNAVISSVVIYNHYLDSKTVTVYLTNLLFMGSKVYDVYSTVNTDKNIFYSAYLKNKVQFNDVDPDKLISDEDNINDLENNSEKKDDDKSNESDEIVEAE